MGGAEQGDRGCGGGDPEDESGHRARRLAGKRGGTPGPIGILPGAVGKVVDIETAGSEAQGSTRKRRARRKPSKTALVLGGGGFTGGVYEIGALRAIDLLATNRR